MMRRPRVLAAIEPDVEELEDAIAAIEEPGVARRLGISDSEVRFN
jgi:hypothetical protein